MAITITTLNGTDSVSSSRITINDNFSTILSAVNSVLSMIDISSGKIKNSTYPGSSNNIETQDITITGNNGLTVNSGPVTLTNGNIVLTNGKLIFGPLTIERTSKTVGSSSYPTLNFSGISATGGAGTSAYLTIPRLANSTIIAIPTPPLGSIVYDTTNNRLCVCTASGAVGTWTPVH